MKMQAYHIAGHTLETSERLGNLPGFSPFLASGGGPRPALVFHTGQPIGEEEGLRLIYTCRLEETEDRCDWLINEAGDYFFRLYSDNSVRYRMTVRPDNEGRIARTDMNEATSPWLLRFFLWMAFNLSVLEQGTSAIHASTITCGGKAVLFLGESGTGKSTHSSLWLQHLRGVELLNDDCPFIRCEARGQVKVYGSPWSGKTDCYKNQSSPMAALVLLRQAPRNEIRSLQGIAAVGAVLPAFPPAFAQVKQATEAIQSLLSQLLDTVPVYILDCLPDADAARLVYDTLKQDGRI
jgi:hypothetical protein